MIQKTIQELLDYISQAHDTAAIQIRWSEYRQAVEWAEQQQRWDLVIELVEALFSHLIYSRPIELNMEGQDNTQVMRNFWEQGRELTAKGLIAARQLGKVQNEVGFLATLARLSGYLTDFENALNYLKQELQLVEPEWKWRITREILRIGKEANSFGDFSAARDYFQAALEVHIELDNKQSIAATLAHIAANETERIERELKTEEQIDIGIYSVIEELWELSKIFRQQAALEESKASLDQASIEDQQGEMSVELLYQRLKDALVKLNSLS